MAYRAVVHHTVANRKVAYHTHIVAHRKIKYRTEKYRTVLVTGTASGAPEATGDEVTRQTQDAVRTAIDVLDQHINVAMVARLSQSQQLVETLQQHKSTCLRPISVASVLFHVLEVR